MPDEITQEGFDLVTADLVADAEARGYARAVAALRDERRYELWCEQDMAAGGSHSWPHFAHAPRFADYLEDIAGIVRPPRCTTNRRWYPNLADATRGRRVHYECVLPPHDEDVWHQTGSGMRWQFRPYDDEPGIVYNSNVDPGSPLAVPGCTCPWNNELRPAADVRHHVNCPTLARGHHPDDGCNSADGVVHGGHRDDLLTPTTTKETTADGNNTTG